MIHVLTPIRKGEPLAYDVTEQSVECRRFTHSCELENRRDNEALNRNKLKVHASDPYTILMDADVVLPESDTFERMVAMMEKHQPIPAMAVDTKGLEDGKQARNSDIGHAVIALLIIRKSVLDGIMFNHLDLVYNHPDLAKDFNIRGYPVAKGCVCTQVNCQIRTWYGFPIPYIRGIRATEEKKKITGG